MPKSAIVDDMAMIRAASELTRDLVTPSARISWAAFLASAFVGYAGVVAAILAPSTPWILAAALVAVLALYPPASFIPETTHIRTPALPASPLGRAILIAFPLLPPSSLYGALYSPPHTPPPS